MRRPVGVSREARRARSLASSGATARELAHRTAHAVHTLPRPGTRRDVRRAGSRATFTLSGVAAARHVPAAGRIRALQLSFQHRLHLRRARRPVRGALPRRVRRPRASASGGHSTATRRSRSTARGGATRARRRGWRAPTGAASEHPEGVRARRWDASRGSAGCRDRGTCRGRRAARSVRQCRPAYPSVLKGQQRDVFRAVWHDDRERKNLGRSSAYCTADSRGTRPGDLGTMSSSPGATYATGERARCIASVPGNGEHGSRWKHDRVRARGSRARSVCARRDDARPLVRRARPRRRGVSVAHDRDRDALVARGVYKGVGVDPSEIWDVLPAGREPRSPTTDTLVVTRDGVGTRRVGPARRGRVRPPRPTTPGGAVVRFRGRRVRPGDGARLGPAARGSSPGTSTGCPRRWSLVAPLAGHADDDEKADESSRGEDGENEATRRDARDDGGRARGEGQCAAWRVADPSFASLEGDGTVAMCFVPRARSTKYCCERALSRP